MRWLPWAPHRAAGNLVGIDIDHASRKVDLRRLVLSNMPGKVETVAA